MFNAFLKQKYDKGEAPFQCVQKVGILLPRCAHEANVSCDKAQQLKSWRGEACVPDKTAFIAFI